MWWRRKKTMQQVEKELVSAKAKYDIYRRTFLAQSSFTDYQRDKLVSLYAKMKVLECELNEIKFKEVIDDEVSFR